MFDLHKRKNIPFSRFCAAIFLSSLLAPALCFSELLPLPDCQGPGCVRTASSTAWPPTLHQSLYTLELQQYVISLPAPPKRIVRQWSGELTVASLDGSWLAFNLVTTYSDVTKLESREKVPTQSKFTVAESGEFTFTKTINDPAPTPTDPGDLWVWRQALSFKSQVFGPDNPVYYARDGHLTIYFGTTPEIDNAFQAYAFDRSNPNTYIRIFATDITYEQFTRILGSMKLN